MIRDCFVGNSLTHWLFKNSMSKLKEIHALVPKLVFEF